MRRGAIDFSCAEGAAFGTEITGSRRRSSYVSSKQKGCSRILIAAEAFRQILLVQWVQTREG